MTMIQVRMKDTTLNQLDRITQRVHAPSRSDAIRRAIEISDFITKFAEHGGQVILENQDGRKTRVVIPGIMEG